MTLAGAVALLGAATGPAAAQSAGVNDPRKLFEPMMTTLHIEAYARAAPYLLPPAERLEVPFGERGLPIYCDVPTVAARQKRGRP